MSLNIPQKVNSLLRTLDIFSQFKTYVEFSLKIDFNILKEMFQLNYENAREYTDYICYLMQKDLDVSEEDREKLTIKLKEDFKNCFVHIFMIYENNPEINKLELIAEVEDDYINGYIFDENHFFLLTDKSDEEIYFKYMNVIRRGKVKKIEKNIAVVESEEKFSSFYPIEEVETDFTCSELKRILNCIVQGKPIVPEYDLEPCRYKDFLGLKFVENAQKITKINDEHSKFKIGDIILPGGKIIRDRTYINF